VTLPDGALPLPDHILMVPLGHVDNIQKTPAWSAFNALVQHNCEVRKSIVGCLPVIPTSPTELSTVYLLLKRYGNSQLPLSLISQFTLKHKKWYGKTDINFQG
jgi:hypothetical protein